MAESSVDVINERRAGWRYLENGKYDKRPIDPNYFKKLHGCTCRVSLLWKACSKR